VPFRITPDIEGRLNCQSLDGSDPKATAFSSQAWSTYSLSPKGAKSSLVPVAWPLKLRCWVQMDVMRGVSQLHKTANAPIVPGKPTTPAILAPFHMICTRLCRHAFGSL